MSGIAGVIRFGGTSLPHELQAMLRNMQARGPDRHAMACIGEAGFAHALLATTPEAQLETQPWRHPESGCLLVADSRLDNRADLLRALGIGRPVDDIGDCELLHAAWQHWGTDCADRVRGDFAFALWDPGQRELFVARDPMGVRPFAFHFAAGRLFVFGSTTDIVMAQGQVPTDLDEGRIADVLIAETEGVDPVCTLYKAIQRLPPAHWMLVRVDRLEQHRYWRPVGESRPPDLPLTDTEWIHAQREQLERAVRLRMRSQRPVGAMLSGGLDSSSVVALAAHACDVEGRPPLPVFPAIDSGNSDCAETRHARAVARHVRCLPTWVDLATFEREAATQPAWWDSGVEPFDGAMSMIAALYRTASLQGVASLLDGTPADNLYSSGQHARELLRRGHWAHAWQVAVAQNRAARHPRVRALKTMAGATAPDGVRALRHWWQDRREYRALLERSAISTALAERVDLWQRYRRYSTGIDNRHQWHASGEASSSMAAAYITAGIERYNRVASLFGVEPRHPFADRDLIEFQAWMPASLRVRDGHRKWVLRQAMVSDLPDSVRWRSDKSHLGWRFSRAQMSRSHASPTSLEATLAEDWVMPPATAHATEHDAHHVNPQLFPALALERWRRSQAALRTALGVHG